MNFLNELKRRNIYKAATLYVVAGWVLLQVSDTVLPAFGFSDRGFRILTIVLLVGFPIALILAWLFEIDEHGVRRTLPAAVELKSGSATTDYVVIALLLVVVAMTSWEQFAGSDPVTGISTTEVAATTNEERIQPRVTRAELNLGNPDLKTQSRTRSYIALSNDGQQLAYSFRKGDTERLMLRDLSQLEARVLFERETGYLTAIDFSPDDSKLVFNAGFEIHVLDIATGIDRTVIPQTTADTAPLWSSIEEFLISEGNDSVVYSINATNGAREEFFRHENPEVNIGRVRFLPERNAALMTISIGGGRYRVDVVDLHSGQSKVLVENAIRPDYADTGHLTFVLSNSLWAVPFDLESLEITGNEQLMVENIESTTTFQMGAYEVSNQGRLVYIPSDGRQLHMTIPTLVSYDGTETPLDLPPSRYGHPTLSPDGSILAIKEGNGTSTGSLWLYNLETGVYEQRTFNERLVNPIWSNNSDKLFFTIVTGEMSGERSQLFEMQASGLGGRTLLQSFEGVVFPTISTPDDSKLIFGFLQGQRDWSLGHVSLTDTNPAMEQILASGDAPTASLSPDGKYIVYSGISASGGAQSFIRPYPNLEDGMWSLPVGSAEARWSKDGSRIFYIDQGAKRLLSIPVTSEPPFFTGTPSLVVEDLAYDNFTKPNYGLGADDNSVIVLKRIENSELYSSTTAILVDNWFTELSRLAPTF